MNFGPSSSKAVSLRTSRVVYCRQFGSAKLDWEVIDSETGEVNTLNPAQFQALYVPGYRALGNSFAVPVMRWLGERIAGVEGQRKSPAEGPGSGTCR